MSSSSVGALLSTADSSAPVRPRSEAEVICERMIDAARWFAEGLRRDSKLCPVRTGVHLLAAGAETVVGVLEMERDRILSARPALRQTDMSEVLARSANAEKPLPED